MLPTGTVTFLFTDIEGSTQLFQRDAHAMDRALIRHNELLNRTIAGNGGTVFQIIGDAFCAAFADAGSALTAAVQAQREIHHESWENLGSFRVRMGLHTGPAQLRGNAYPSSLTLVRVQRVMSAAHGGQTLLSGPAAAETAGSLPDGVTLRELGNHRLRGLAEPEELFQAVATELPNEFPPVKSVAQETNTRSAWLSHLVDGQIIGRDRELELLREHWSLATQARGHLVLISGEPGVGKSRLAKAAMEEAGRTGAVLMRGGCYENEATTPYLPFVEAVRDWVHWQAPGHLKEVLGPTAPEVVKFAPEIETKIGPITPNQPLPANDARLRLFDAVARFFQSVSGPNGLFLYLDDLHWADQSTLALLHYVMRHLRNDRVLLVGGYREVELDRRHPLSSSLAEWSRDQFTARIAVNRLAREDTAVLLRSLFGQDTVSSDFVDLLFSETEGNPFFVEESVKALIEQGSIFRDGDKWEQLEVDDLSVPQSVKEAIGRRLNRLDDGTIRMLHTAAALGKQFAFDDLSPLVDQTEDALLDALDEAVAAQLLEGLNNDEFVFTHDKIREVLYEEISPIRRRRLHQRIGEQLAAVESTTRESRARDIAFHFMQSGDLEQSLAYGEKAARLAAEVNALDEAQSSISQAREAADALGRSREVARLDEYSGDLLMQQGMANEAATAFQRAITAAPDTDRGRLRSKTGRALATIGDDSGLGFLERALDELDRDREPVEYARTLAAIGRYHHYRARHAEANKFLVQALSVAEEADDVSALSDIYAYLAGSYQQLAEFDLSNEWAQKCIALGEKRGSRLASAIGYEFQAENEFGRGAWRKSIDLAAENRRIGEALGALDRVAWSTLATSSSLYYLGDLDGADLSAMEGLELAERIGEVRLAAWLCSGLARSQADRGNFKSAAEHAERAIRISEQLDQPVITVVALDAAAYQLLRSGHPGEAADCCRRILETLSDTENVVAKSLTYPRVATTLFQTGSIDEARPVADEALAIARRAGIRYQEARALEVIALIVAEDQKWNEALETINLAVDGLHETETLLLLATCLLSRASILARKGEAQAAESDRTRAREIFESAGAIEYARA